MEFADSLTIALSKGRIFTQTLPLLARAGIVPRDDPETSRKLILETNQPRVRLVIIRAGDVPTYVQYGAADLGVTGKDVLMEHGGGGLYEPLDLRIARCRMMVAGVPDAELGRDRLRLPPSMWQPSIGALRPRANRRRSSSSTARWSSRLLWVFRT